jgi:hypothetical protein
VEAKSLRARLDSHHTFEAYSTRLERDMHKAFRQVGKTASMIREGHTVFGGAIDASKPMCAVVVTPEPLWLANRARFTSAYPDPTVPTAILSLRELEDVVAYSCAQGDGSLWLAVTEADEAGDRNPGAALYRHQQKHGLPSNPLLKQSYEQGAWH